MLRMLEAAGDRLLSLVVPRIGAFADPSCECAGQAGKVITPYCSCRPCTGQSIGTVYRDRCTCDGCHWHCRGTCQADHNNLCMCP